MCKEVISSYSIQILGLGASHSQTHGELCVNDSIASQDIIATYCSCIKLKSLYMVASYLANYLVIAIC